MCGPSGNENQLESSAQSFSNLLSADFGSRFASQNQTLQNLNQSLQPILQGGPSQQGFSPQELASLNTAAINNAGAANRNAQQAAGNFAAGQNNPSGLTSGITKQINASINSNSANQLANTQNAITQGNYNQGSANYWRAQGGFQTLANQYDPTAFSRQAIDANQNAFGEANQINQQENQKQAAIGGLIASAIPFAGKGLAGGLANLDQAGTSSGGEQGGNFLSGAFGALAG